MRRGEGGAALTGADARAVLAANRDAWEEVLEVKVRVRVRVRVREEVLEWRG